MEAEKEAGEQSTGRGGLLAILLAGCVSNNNKRMQKSSSATAQAPPSPRPEET